MHGICHPNVLTVVRLLEVHKNYLTTETECCRIQEELWNNQILSDIHAIGKVQSKICQVIKPNQAR